VASELDPEPESLSCAVCGNAVDDAGYLPATDHGATYEPVPDEAVCGTCGFNEVGMAGCAPTVDDMFDSGPDGVLLYVQRTECGFDVVSVKR